MVAIAPWLGCPLLPSAGACAHKLVLSLCSRACAHKLVISLCSRACAQTLLLYDLQQACLHLPVQLPNLAPSAALTLTAVLCTRLPLHKDNVSCLLRLTLPHSAMRMTCMHPRARTFAACCPDPSRSDMHTVCMRLSVIAFAACCPDTPLSSMVCSRLFLH